MMNVSKRIPLSFDNQAVYQICVQGRIDPTWTDNLEGMTIYNTAVEAGFPITTLVGNLYDQAALAGVLNSLYELHLTVLSVQRLNI